MITPEEFEIEMLQCFDFSDSCNDRQRAHYDACELMCKLLKQLGYGGGIDVFERLNKW